MLSVTPIYLGLIALYYLVLTFKVVGARRATKVSLGDGGDARLNAAIRAHGNCAEYAPLTILLMITAELQGTPGWVLHCFGVALIFSRIGHATALTGQPQIIIMRQISMLVTLTSIGLLALGNLAHAIF